MKMKNVSVEKLKNDAVRLVDHNRNLSVTHFIPQAIRFLLFRLMEG